ncbi:MAG: HAMP domain-containing histidine kinase [Bacteroidetes bacterium]|nr:HAMP domain-containing histidine kinase [Bacteroidota bacterium]
MSKQQPDGSKIGESMDFMQGPGNTIIFTNTNNWLYVNENSQLQVMDTGGMYFPKTKYLSGNFVYFTQSPTTVCKMNDPVSDSFFMDWYRNQNGYVYSAFYVDKDEFYVARGKMIFYYNKGVIKRFDETAFLPYSPFYTIVRKHLVVVSKGHCRVYYKGAFLQETYSELASSFMDDNNLAITSGVSQFSDTTVIVRNYKGILQFKWANDSLHIKTELQIARSDGANFTYFDQSTGDFFITSILGGFILNRKKTFMNINDTSGKSDNAVYNVYKSGNRLLTNNDFVKFAVFNTSYDNWAPIVKMNDKELLYPSSGGYLITDQNALRYKRTSNETDLQARDAVTIGNNTYLLIRHPHDNQHALYNYSFINHKAIPVPLKKINTNAGPQIICSRDSASLFAIADYRLCIIDLHSNSITAISDSLFYAEPRGLTYDSENGLVFITGRNKGIWCYSTKRNKLIQLPPDAQNSLLFCHYVLKDNMGYYWMPTNTGLYLMEQPQLFDYLDGRKAYISYHRFGKEYGMTVEEFNGGFSDCGLVDGDSVYFASMSGVVKFSSKNIQRLLTNQHASIFLEAVLINDIAVKQQNQTLIPANFERLTFLFNFPYSKIPNLNLEWRLLGIADTAWQPLTIDGKVLLHNLLAGKYKVEVRAVNNDLIQPLSYTFIVQQYWYLRWWAWLGYAVLLSAGLTLLYSWRISILKNKSLSAIDQNRQQLFTIIAHDLRTPVKAYNNLAESINFLIKKGQYDRIKKISAQIDETGAGLDLLLQNLLNWSLVQQKQLKIKPVPVNILDIIKDLSVVYTEFARQKEVQLSITSAGNTNIETDPGMLSLILRNLLDNAVKYAVTQTVVQVAVTEMNEAITIRLSNTFNRSGIEALIRIQQLFSVQKDWEPGKEGSVGLKMIQLAATKINSFIIIDIVNDTINWNISLPKTTV